MKKTVSLVFAVVFLVLCALPTAGFLLTGGAKAGANEVLTQKPALQCRDGTLNTEYFTALADYVGDRFSLRQEFITLWARLNADFLGSSSTPDVIVGTDGWLYFVPTLESYTRSSPMSEREVWCCARTLSLMQEYVHERGGDFLFAVAPNKNSLYNEHMPDFDRADVPSDAERLQELLSEDGVNTLDLFALFADEDEVLYFPTDSHWNGRGAALAADAILSVLGIESGYYAGEFRDATHRGDLYEMLYPAGTDTDADFVFAPGFTFTASSENPDSITISTQGAGERNMLVYRDSFGRNLYPYLAESAREAVFSRKNSYDLTAMTDGGAVVIELVERNLRYLIENTPVLPAAMRDAAAIEGAVESGEFMLEAKPVGALVLVSGSFGDLTPDDTSPVYVRLGDAVFEAVPTPSGFSALVPETDAEDVNVIYFSSGELISLRGITLP